MSGAFSSVPASMILNNFHVVDVEGADGITFFVARSSMALGGSGIVALASALRLRLDIEICPIGNITEGQRRLRHILMVYCSSFPDQD